MRSRFGNAFKDLFTRLLTEEGVDLRILTVWPSARLNAMRKLRAPGGEVPCSALSVFGPRKQLWLHAVDQETTPTTGAALISNEN